jgi:acetate kinase
MTDVLAVLNAGSSSVKFTLFGDGGGDDPPVLCRGQVEAITTAPHFIARDGVGAVMEERSWEEGASFGHQEAIAFLFEWLTGQFQGHRPLAVGHRVVHGGLDFDRPVRATNEELMIARHTRRVLGV